MRLSCSICLEEVTENSELVALAVCGRVFDAECIEQCLRMNDKCPLCNQYTYNNHPAYKRVYFSALEGNADEKSALLAAKEELATAQENFDTLNGEYDELALKWAIAKDELNTMEDKKSQLEKDNALKDAQIDKLTHNWQTSKAKNKDDMDKMNLKLIAKQKAIDLLADKLDTSNKRIKTLKDELNALKTTDTQDNALPPKSRYRDQNFKNKYYDLSKDHKALKDKMGQLEKKFIDLTLTTPTPSSSSMPSSQTESLQANIIQDLEKQLQESVTKEKKHLKEVMRFKQLKQDAVKEKEDLQAKLANAEAMMASMKHDTKKDSNLPHREAEPLLD